MAASNPVDLLPPEARFALRAVAAGLAIDEAGSVLRLDGPTVRKHLRSAGRGLDVATPPPSEGDAALLAALAPALAAGREAPVRPPSMPCPAPDVAAALAAGQLDGPLMLPEAEHAADCAACLARLVAGRKAGIQPAAVVAAGRRASRWPLVVGVAVGLAAAAWWLFN
jgi:hypothetical protein